MRLVHANRFGISVPCRSVSLQDALELALAAESWGYAEAWTDEVDAVDGLTPLAWLAGKSTALTLGVGVVPVSTRPAALLALSAAALQQLSGGRFILGLGASTPNVVEEWMGLPRSPRVSALEETIDLLRLVFTGEKVDFPGENVHMSGFRLRSGPCDVPLYIGGHGRRTLGIAGAVADGIVLGNVSASWIPRLLDDVGAGADAAGRERDEVDVVCRVVVGVNEDREALDLDFRRTIVSYATSTAYRDFFSRMGWAEAMTDIARAWDERNGARAVAAVPKELVEELFVVGSPEACAARLREFMDAGVKSLLVHPTCASTDPEARATRMHAALRDLGTALIP